MWELLLPFLGSLFGAGANYLGNTSAANTAAGASNAASQAGLQGTREGIEYQKEIYNKDRQREYEAAQYLKGFLPNFDMNLVNPQNYFGEGNVNRYFDLSKSALGQNYQRALTEAGTGAGEMAASRGLLNPSLSVRSAQNDVMGTYAPQFTGLEASRAGALLQNNKDLYQALLNNQQYQNALRQLGYTNQFQLASNFGNPNIAPTPFEKPKSNYTPTPQYGSRNSSTQDNMAYARYYTGGGRMSYEEWLKQRNPIRNPINSGYGNG